MKNKVDLTTIGNVFKKGCRIVGYGIIAAVACSLSDTKQKSDSNNLNVYYSDAIRAINESNLWSNDKKKAIALLNKNGTPDYYKAIIEIVESTMWSNDILESIRIISEQ